MRNANLRIRCISDEALASLIDLLKEESNGVFIESWPTNESPRTEGREAIIYGPNDDPRRGLGAKTGNRGNRAPARKRSRT